MNKAAFLEKKEQEKELRRLTNQMIKTEKRIGEVEDQIRMFEKSVASPSGSDEQRNDPDFYRRYERLQKEMEDLLSAWERNHSELEAFKNKRN
jgi:septal ring factor EnvC (AmiA/AmiB activator)